MPKVSVIMPTFNRVSFLRDAIESVLLQNFEDFEIIITDNASTDSTRELVVSFNNNRIIYFRHEKNVGVVNNYNKALQLATGEYIYIFSDDDVMLQGNIMEKAKVLDNYPNIGLVHSNIRMINEAGQVVIDKHWATSYYDKWQESHSSSTLFSGLDYFQILYTHWNIISMPSVMVRSSVLDEVGILNANTHYFCDWDLWLRICLVADIYYINEKLLDYRIHTSNTISEINQDIKKNELISVKRMLLESYSDKIHHLGLSEQYIEKSVIDQIAKYPLAEVQEESIINTPSIISRIKNKITSFVS